MKGAGQNQDVKLFYLVKLIKGLLELCIVKQVQFIVPHHSSHRCFSKSTPLVQDLIKPFLKQRQGKLSTIAPLINLNIFQPHQKGQTFCLISLTIHWTIP